MDIINRIGYASGILIMTGTWMLAALAYVFHIAFTLVTIGSVEHSGQAFYLIAGILFPPLGVFNGLFIWLA